MGRIVGHVDYGTAPPSGGCRCHACGQTVPADELVIDRETRCLTRRGATVELTAREFAILVAVHEKKPNVVSKESIYTRVWGYDSDCDPKAIDIYLCKMRKKIKELGIDLRTVYGAGLLYTTL